jgi:hypothetical protein
MAQRPSQANELTSLGSTDVIIAEDVSITDVGYITLTNFVASIDDLSFTFTATTDFSSATVIGLTSADVGLGNVPNEDATDPYNLDQRGASDGQVLTWDSGNTRWQPETISTANDKAGVSSNDTTPDYLKNKLVAGSGVTLTEQNDGGNETLKLDAGGRWTLEAEIDLSAQGSSFFVTNLPAAHRWVFEFVSVIHDDASGSVDLEMQLSDDNGSTAISTTDYDERALVIEDATTPSSVNNDRWKINEKSEVRRSGNELDWHGTVTVYNPSNSTSEAVRAWAENILFDGFAEIKTFKYGTTTSSTVDAVKISLSSKAFGGGTLYVWSE